MNTKFSILGPNGKPLIETKKTRRKQTLIQLLSQIPAEFVLINPNNQSNEIVMPEDLILETSSIIEDKMNRKYFYFDKSLKSQYYIKETKEKPYTQYKFGFLKGDNNEILNISVKSKHQTIYTLSYL